MRSYFDLVFSEYPIQRSKKDSEGIEMGVAGSVSLLQNVTLSTQPISSLDWSPDKRGLCVCSSFDQTVRVLIVTKLHKIWLQDFGLTEFKIGSGILWPSLNKAGFGWWQKPPDTSPWASLQPLLGRVCRLACCCAWMSEAPSKLSPGPVLFFSLPFLSQ